MLDRENYVAKLRAFALAIGAQHDQPAPKALAHGLGATEGSFEFYRRLAEVFELIRRASEQVEEISDDPNYEAYQGVIGEIRNRFEQLDLRENWNKYGSVFHGSNVTLLETCARVVASRLRVQEPTQEALDQALTDVQDAITAVLDADIEADARQVLVEMLHEVEGALLSYKVSGVVGLRRAVERVLGMAYAHKELLETAKTKSAPAVARAFKAVLRVVSALRTADYAVYQLPERVVEVFRVLSETIP